MTANGKGGDRGRNGGRSDHRNPARDSAGGRLGDTDSGRQLAELLKALQPSSASQSSSPPPPAVTKTGPHSGRKPNGAFPKQATTGQEVGRHPRSQPDGFRPKPTKPPSRKPPETVRISSQKLAEIYALADEASGFRTATQPKITLARVVTDFGRAAFERIRAMRPELEGLVADAQAAPSLDTRTHNGIQQRIALGTTALHDIIGLSEGFIGCDFGTSSTKTVVRWPYDAAEGFAFAVPVPSAWCSGGIPHLWPTAVYFNPTTKMFAAIPGQGYHAITGFKSALLDKRSHRMCGHGLTNADAGVAFLAQHLAYVLGVVREKVPEKKVSLVNFGVPVAKLSESDVTNDFRRVIEAALSLIGKADNLSFDDVRGALAKPEVGPLEATYHAELSGAIAGYCSAPRHRQGAHMIIDCGSATLDIASFELTDSKWPIGIYAAQVEPLGADACRRYIAAGASDDECRKASRYQEAEVSHATSQLQPIQYAAHERRYGYQVILVGGGVSSSVHQPLLERMEQAFDLKFYRPRLSPTLNRDRASQDTRLILADGLARDPFDLREVVMPLDREKNQAVSGNMGNARGTNWEITKDQV